LEKVSMINVRSEMAKMHYGSLDVARQALDRPRPCGAKSLVEALKPPSKLQFRLRYFLEHESTDKAAQGASDEVWLSAIGSDSSSVTLGPRGEPQVDLIHSASIGDVTDDETRDRFRKSPFVLLEFDLRKPSDWPRAFTATLLLIEHDNGDLAEGFKELHAEVGGTIQVAVVTAATTASAALAGAAIGSVIPGIGTAVGAAVGALAAVAYDEVIEKIKKGLADEVFKPIPITLTIPKPWLAAGQAGVNVELAQKLQEHDAHYDIIYDWHTVS